MDFVNPLLLGGMLAAAVPIVLHLVLRQKPRFLELPSLRFLKQRRDANRRRLRLRHVLLLALRVLAIVLLALALARPSIKSRGGVGDAKTPVAAALVFDTSLRMEYRHANQSRLEAARGTADWLLAQLPSGSDVAVLDSSLAAPVFQVDLGAAQERIKRLETTSLGQSAPRVVTAALRLLKRSRKTRHELYVFTDMTRASWSVGDDSRVARELENSHDVALYLVDVGVPSPQNMALGELRLSAQVLAKNNALHIETALSCDGRGGQRSVELYLTGSDGKRQKRDQRSCSLQPGGSQVVDFTVGALGDGLHQGWVRVVGEDGLSHDDERFFTVEVRDAWRVLVVAQTPAVERALFWTEALAPQAFRASGQARFQCDVIPFAELESHPLDAYAAACLLDPAPLVPAAWSRLAGYVAAGGSVAIFLGEAAENVQAFNQSEAQQLLPGRLASQVRSPDGNRYLATEYMPHPLLRKFSERREPVPWENFPIYRAWRFEGLPDESAILLRYNDREPALLERRVGGGRVLVMTTPIASPTDSEPWNLLPIGLDAWPFVMLANEMMYYLVGSRDEQLNYTTGQTAVLELPPATAISTYLLTAPRGDRSRRNIDALQNAIVISALSWWGHWRVESGGEARRLDRGFSVNTAVEDSQLDRIKPEELEKVFGTSDFHLARSRDEIRRDIGVGRIGRELYPWVIVLVALALGLEHWISNRFYREA